MINKEIGQIEKKQYDGKPKPQISLFVLNASGQSRPAERQRLSN